VKRFITWLLLVILFGGFGWIAYWALAHRAEAGKGMPAFSMYSRDRDGLAELAKLFKKLGFEAMAVTRPIQQTDARGLLILVEPEGNSLFPGQPPDLPEADARGLLHWVAQGNALLLCCRQMNALHRELQVTIVGDDPAYEEESLQKAVMEEVGGYSHDLDHLVIKGNDFVEPLSHSVSAEVPLWWVGDQPGAILTGWGKGRVFVVADPSLLTLPGLRRGDNVMFAINVARLHAMDHRIYFDEYHHGLRSGGGFWGYLRYHDDQWMIGAVVLAAAMAGWAVAIRLGRAIPKANELQADAVDYASAVARIYECAGARHLLAQILARDFQVSLARNLRLRSTALPVEILAAWHAKVMDGKSKTEDGGLAGLLRGLSELRKGDVSERELLMWMQKFDRFRLGGLRLGDLSLGELSQERLARR
jgi:hypothetical protein